MSDTYTQEQYDQEYALFVRSPGWELQNIQKALRMLPWLNGSQEEARLAAVKKILNERRAR
jgi:hypothetical protein